MLTRQQARAFYDRMGSFQDRQAFYEDRALDELVAHAEFESARGVFELGCGTGRLAERLLSEHLSEQARYLGVDLSSEMVRIARRRLARFEPRAEVRLVDGEPRVPPYAGPFDRFVSSYVLDLLPEDEIRRWLAEAHRTLAPDGRIALVGLTRGNTPLSRLVIRLWSAVHGVSPRLVGGCRPVELDRLLGPEGWRVLHHAVVVAWGLPSEVVVAARLECSA